MLALPIKFIKDAAKSVKRICEQEFTKVTDSVLTELLGISSLVVTMFALRREDDKDVLHLMCAHRNNVAICPKCGAFTESVHEEKKRCVRHLDIWGKKTFLHFLSRRFKCSDCGKQFTEESDFVDQLRRQSLDFEMHIYRHCLSDNRKDVTNREGLSQSMVKGIFLRYAKMKVKPGHPKRCPRVMVLKEEFRFIFERAKYRDKAEKYLKVWKLKASYTGNSFLLKFLKTLENLWNEILNYFFERITNGFVEGLNGAIRSIIRRAFGYRNFNNFRYQVIAEQDFPTNRR